MSIPFSERDLMGLNFFVIVDGPAEIVVDMGMGDQRGDLLNRFDRIKPVKMGSHIEMPEI
jgi:hypothetical protein